MQVRGAAEALRMLSEIQAKKKIDSYYLYHGLLRKIYLHLERRGEARVEFEIAMKLTKSEIEKKLMRSRLSAIPHVRVATG